MSRENADLEAPSAKDNPIAIKSSIGRIVELGITNQEYSIPMLIFSFSL
jgi:hypothetical protein